MNVTRAAWVAGGILLITTFALAIPRSLDADADDRMLFSEHQDAFLASEEADMARDHLAAILKPATNKDLGQLCNARAASIALAASWERLRRRVCQTPAELAAEGTRFLGILEGRLRCRPPAWWESMIANATLDAKGNIVVPRVSEKLWEVSDIEIEKLNFQTRKGTALRKRGRAWMLKIGDEARPVSRDLIMDKYTDDDLDQICGVFTNDRTYMVFMHISSAEHTLVCFGRTGQVIWENKGMADGRTVAVGGGGYCCLELVVTEEDIVVFGQNVGAFAQAHDRRTGKRKAWFSTELYTIE